MSEKAPQFNQANSELAKQVEVEETEQARQELERRLNKARKSIGSRVVRKLFGGEVVTQKVAKLEAMKRQANGNTGTNFNLREMTNAEIVAQQQTYEQAKQLEQIEQPASEDPFNPYGETIDYSLPHERQDALQQTHVNETAPFDYDFKSQSSYRAAAAQRQEQNRQMALNAPDFARDPFEQQIKK